MNTKNIFKTLAAAMLLPAMLLTTACSSEDDLANSENVAKKGYTLPVTVSVTRQGDDATTRAAFNGETKKLEFTSGDQLLVKGYHATAGGFAGILDFVSDDKFSGEITTDNSYEGTADALFSTAYGAAATLLPAGYGTYGFLVLEGSGSVVNINANYANAIADTKATAVEQFSIEDASSYSSGFALKPRNAILNFTITDLAPSTDVTVNFTGTGNISKSVTTDASGTATFAIAELKDLNDCSLTVDGNAVTLVSSSKTLTAGKIYNITRSAAPASLITSPAVGQIIGSDGKNYAADATLPTGVTKVAMIAYVSGSNGLAIALSDEASTMDWDTANGATGAAAHTPVVTGQTWKLPSMDEWKQMFKANGGSETSYTDLNTAITNAGGTALQYPYGYWSSSDFDSTRAYVVIVQENGSTYFYGGMPKSGTSRVRACLAFSVESSAVAPKAAAEATAEDLGKVIGADGNIYADAAAATAAGTTALAKIMYVGSDAETDATYNHGLALALSDVSEGQYWCDQSSNICLTTQYSSSAATGDMAGIANTEALVNHGSHTHAAASAARGYNSSIHPTGTSEWFLPSAGQWVKMATAAGGYANLKTNADLQKNTYWSSTESTEYGSGNAAWYVSISGNKLDCTTKNYFNWPIRACLAF